MHSRRLVCLLATAAAVVWFGCDSTPETQEDEPVEQPAHSEPEPLEPEERIVRTGDGEEVTAAEVLNNPQLAGAEAPGQFEVDFQTTRGDFTITVHREWAPHGADRLYNLVRIGYYDGVAFFRVIDNFIAQFGMRGDPEVDAAWQNAQLPDDEVRRSNVRSKVSFAISGPDSRTTQLFINTNDNAQSLDDRGFSPVGEVTEGMDVVDSLYGGYGESPEQERIRREGNDYLRDEFENLDWIERASIVE